MKAFAWQDVDGIKVDKIMFLGEPREVKGITIRWLSKAGADANGNPKYGLRHFTAEPGGEIPIHSHAYHQTVYILTGQFECWSGDPENGRITETRICGPGDVVFSPSMDPHGMKNLSDTDPATFLCCIGTIKED